MKKMILSYKMGVFFASIGIFGFLAACSKNIPDSLDSLSDEVNYAIRSFSPYVGRVNTFKSIVNFGDKSTLPLNFAIINPRTASGVAAPELLLKHKVKVWERAYTGEEKSLEEIEEKRKEEYRSLLEIQKHNGDIVFWNASSSSRIKTIPDEGYIFDVEISNSGGRRYQRELVLTPKKERDFEPSQYDDVTGLAKMSYVYPWVGNMFGPSGRPVRDIRVYFFKNEDKNVVGNTLTISVIDSLGVPLDIQNIFRDTDFENLVHGFKHRFIDKKLVYDVAYPIPLVNYPTRYTNSSGDRALISLRRNRIGRLGFIEPVTLNFEFAIYREGHWEIQFRFNEETPLFENER